MQYQQQKRRRRQQQKRSGEPFNSPARAAPQRGCVGRHLANRNELPVSRSDSYALLFLYSSCRVRELASNNTFTAV